MYGTMVTSYVVNHMKKGQHMSKIKPLASKTYGGGGKVLSVILAGTLALGMTPAAALSQAALDVTPAYASEGQPGSSADNPLEITDWSEFATGGAYQGATVTVEKITNDPRLGELSYTGQAQTISTDDFGVVVKVEPTQGDAVYLSITSKMFEITAALSGGIAGSPAPTCDLENAGTYTVTLSSTGDDNPTFTAGSTNTTNVAVAPAKISADLLKDAVINPQVGIDKPGDLAAASTNKLAEAGESVAATSAKIADLVDYAYPTDGNVYDGSSDTYVKVGDIQVTAKLKTSGSINTNYVIEGTSTFPATVQANTENYTLTYGTIAGDVVTGQTDSKTVDFAAAGQAALNDNIAVTVNKTEGDPGQETVKAVAIADAAYGVAWAAKAGTETPAPPEASGSVPALPGIYEATAQVGGEGGSPAMGKLSLTVAGDLSTVGVLNSGATVFYGGIDVPATGIKLVDTDDPDEVEAQIKAAIESGDLKVTFAPNGGQTVDVPADFLDVSVASADSGVALIQANRAANGAYKGGFNLKYEFGKALPEVETDLSAKPWMGDTGYEIEDLVSFGEESDALVKDRDYTLAAFSVDAEGKETPVSGTTLKAVGSYKIVATPTGDYAGAPVVFTFAIEPYEVKVGENAELTGWTGANVSGTAQDPSTEFTGEAIDLLPVYEVTFADDSTKSYTAVKAGTEEAAAAQVVASFENNTDAGTAAVDVTFQNGLAGSDEETFEITAAPLGAVEGTAPTILATDEAPTADDIEPVVVRNGVTLVKGKDYTVGDITKGNGPNGSGVTEYTFKIIGTGNFTGEAASEGTFKTTTQDIAKLWDIAVAEGTYVYQLGKEVKAPVTIKTVGDSPVTILDSSDTGNGKVALTYSENTDAGTATVTATGIDDYAGTLTATYQIDPLQISDESAANIELLEPEGGFVYAPGKAWTPEIVWATSTIKPDNGAESVSLRDIQGQFEVTYENNDKAGEAQMIITGTGGNIEGSYTKTFEIAPAELTSENVSIAESVAPGASASDAVKVTFGDAVLTAGTDYTVEAEGTLPGTVKATVIGIGNFVGTSGEVTAEVLYDLSKADVSVEPAVYSGEAQTPKVEVSYMVDGQKVVVDPSAYGVTVEGEAADAGSYRVTVAGNEDAGWAGEKQADFVIEPATVSAKPQVSYDAAGLPVVTVPGLTASDFDYKADPATKTITVTYKGNYTGTATVDYKPAPAPTPVPAKTGWVGSGDDWSYYEDGQQVKGGWKWIGNAWYHFEANGQMTNTQWFQDADGTWYLLNQSHKGSYGAMLTGWQKVGGEWYYMNKSGAMLSGWVKDGGEWYYLNAKHDGSFGRMLTGWAKVGKDWYYLDGSGAMLTGWQLVGGKWYYMDASGAMASSEWVGPYWVNASGVWTATR